MRRGNSFFLYKGAFSPPPPYGSKGRGAFPMHPLMVRSARSLHPCLPFLIKGRCRAKRDGGDKSQSAKRASLVMPFLPLLGAECRAGKEGNFAPTGQRGRRDIAEQRSARTRLSLRLIFPQILVPFFREKMVRNGDVRGGVERSETKGIRKPVSDRANQIVKSIRKKAEDFFRKELTKGVLRAIMGSVKI